MLIDPLDRNEFEDCCRPPRGAPPSQYCFNIDVPADDEFFGRFGVRCIDFVRGFPGVRHGCRLGIVFIEKEKSAIILRGLCSKRLDTFQFHYAHFGFSFFVQQQAPGRNLICSRRPSTQTRSTASGNLLPG